MLQQQVKLFTKAQSCFSNDMDESCYARVGILYLGAMYEPFDTKVHVKVA